MEEKSVLISKEIHSKLKRYSLKSGIKMKVLVEVAIIVYLKRMIIEE